MHFARGDNAGRSAAEERSAGVEHEGAARGRVRCGGVLVGGERNEGSPA
jgi:hypothetical protein